MTAHVEASAVLRDITILGVGYAFLYALGLARNRRAIWLAGLAYLAGWALLGLAVSYVMMAGTGFGAVTVFCVAALLTAVFLVVGRLIRAVPDRRGPAATSPAARAASIAGAVVIALAALSALLVSLRSTWTPDADTVALWVPHAGVVYRHGLWIGTSGWNDTYHPEYPPLTSTMYALTFLLSRGFHPALLPFEQWLLGCSFVAAALAMLDRCICRAISFPSVALLLVAPEFFARLDSLLPDQTLAYFVASAALACVLWLHERRTAWLALGVLFSAAGTMTKSEGLGYAMLLLVVVVGAALLLRLRRFALVGLALILGVVAIEPWRLWLSSNGLPTSSTDYRLSSVLHPGYLAHRADRIGYPVHEVLHVMFSPGRWLLVLPLAVLAIGVAARQVPVLATASAVWLVLAFCGLIFVYWAGTFAPFTLRDEVQTSAHRVASTIVIVAALMVPLLLGLGASPARDGDHD
jgi:hypothetical protein